MPFKYTSLSDREMSSCHLRLEHREELCYTFHYLPDPLELHLATQLPWPIHGNEACSKADTLVGRNQP